jgi:ketosteroid isomerase-like protein
VRTRMLVLAVAVICIYASYLAGVIARPARGRQQSQSSSRLGSGDSQIRDLLAAQADAWNRGDIDSFMNSYWKSDETAFVGATGVARGWKAVLERYHRAYPNRQSMGHLTFSNLEVYEDCAGSAFVLGEYHLQRGRDHPSGVFTLNLRKFPEGWRIVLDHTTAFPAGQPVSR